MAYMSEEEAASIARAYARHCGRKEAAKEEPMLTKTRQLQIAQDFAKVEENASFFAKKDATKITVFIGGTNRQIPLLNDTMRSIIRDAMADLAEAANDGMREALKDVVSKDSF